MIQQHQVSPSFVSTFVSSLLQMLTTRQQTAAKKFNFSRILKPKYSTAGNDKKFSVVNLSKMKVNSDKKLTVVLGKKNACFYYFINYSANSFCKCTETIICPYYH